MPAYADAVRPPPRTLTALEQARLLKATGEHREGFRDHVIFALALGTAMREHELVALDVGDVLLDDGRVRRRITLRTFKRSSATPAIQDVFLPDNAWYKVNKLIAWKRAHGESLEPTAPLFVSRRGERLSTRTLRYLIRVWQQRAGIDWRCNFHALRHTALTTVYRSTRDLRLTQRVARHKSIQTTTIYASPSDDDIFDAVRRLSC
jgi:integrase/recombinase XerC